MHFSREQDISLLMFIYVYFNIMGFIICYWFKLHSSLEPYVWCVDYFLYFYSVPFFIKHFVAEIGSQEMFSHIYYSISIWYTALILTETFQDFLEFLLKFQEFKIILKHYLRFDLNPLNGLGNTQLCGWRFGPAKRHHYICSIN